MKVITDGEYRRDDFFTDFLAGLNGVKVVPTSLYQEIFSIPKYEAEGWGIPKQFLANRPIPYADGKVTANPEHPEYYGFEYLKSVTPEGIIPKIVVPTPVYLTIFRSKDDPYPKNAYNSAEEFYDDIAVAYKETFLTFYQKGLRLLQIDEPAIPIFCYLLSTDREEQFRLFHQSVGIFLRILKQVVAALPSDLSVIVHLCRGSGGSHFQVPFTYHDFLPLFAELKPQPKYLLLEWDDERAGSLEVLKEFNTALPNTSFFLGFVTTKSKVVESEEAITARINEAAQYVPLVRLGVTPQCGFGTTKEGCGIPLEIQWGKVKLVADLGKKIWGDK